MGGLLISLKLSFFGGGGGGGGFRGTRGSGRRQQGNMPMNNQAQNRQFEAVVNELKLSKDQARRLHDDIQHMGLGYKELLEHAKNMFNK